MKGGGGHRRGGKQKRKKGLFCWWPGRRECPSLQGPVGFGGTFKLVLEEARVRTPCSLALGLSRGGVQAPAGVGGAGDSDSVHQGSEEGPWLSPPAKMAAWLDVQRTEAPDGRRGKCGRTRGTSSLAAPPEAPTARTPGAGASHPPCGGRGCAHTCWPPVPCRAGRRPGRPGQVLLHGRWQGCEEGARQGLR